MTGIEGDFRIPGVPAGTYEVESSMIGYNTLTVTEVVVAANEVLRLDLVLTSEAIAVDEVAVEVRALRSTEASLLKERQKAPAVSDERCGTAQRRPQPPRRADGPVPLQHAGKTSSP